MTESNLMVKAVFWDMDGTLIDSEPYWHEGEMKIAAAHGGYWDEELAWQGSGTPVPDVARRMVEHGCQLSIEEIGQGMIDYVAQKEFECIPWIEGVEDVLVALRDAGVPSMLVTTSPRHLESGLTNRRRTGSDSRTQTRHGIFNRDAVLHIFRSDAQAATSLQIRGRRRLLLNIVIAAHVARERTGRRLRNQILRAALLKWS